MKTWEWHMDGCHLDSCTTTYGRIPFWQVWLKSIKPFHRNYDNKVSGTDRLTEWKTMPQSPNFISKGLKIQTTVVSSNANLYKKYVATMYSSTIISHTMNSSTIKSHTKYRSTIISYTIYSKTIPVQNTVQAMVHFGL